MSLTLAFEVSMIIALSLIPILFLSNDHKKYKWPICHCPRCQKKMWGHGYVPRYFNNYAQVFFMKRYHCSACGCVITARPDDYHPYQRTSKNDIQDTLESKLRTGSWPGHCTRQRGGHWLKQFINHAIMSVQNDLLKFLNQCFEKNINFFRSKKVELFDQFLYPT